MPARVERGLEVALRLVDDGDWRRGVEDPQQRIAEVSVMSAGQRRPDEASSADDEPERGRDQNPRSGPNPLRHPLVEPGPLLDHPDVQGLLSTPLDVLPTDPAQQLSDAFQVLRGGLRNLVGEGHGMSLWHAKNIEADKINIIGERKTLIRRGLW
jgi:hypothetical protein